MHLIQVSQSFARATAYRRVGYRRRGVSLIGVAFAIVIVAVGIVAIMGFFATASGSNSQLAELNTGMVLATSAHSWANNQPYYGGMDQWVTTPPTGPAIQSDLASKGWTQTFAVHRVSKTNILATSVNPADECLRITVTIKRGTRTVYTASRLYAPGFR